MVRGSAEKPSPAPRWSWAEKSPFIVFDDADLTSAANAQVAAIFFAASARA
ncbi:hypothetical protein M8494_11070 [Serratia ureilytica]